MNYETLLWHERDGIATITLNRPEAMNAFTRTMCAELVDAFDHVSRADAVRAVIVTGSGERAFCAGADLSGGRDTFASMTDPEALAADPLQDGATWRDTGGLVALKVFACSKPVIAAYNGSAGGAGVTMMLPADIRIAVDGVRFAIPQTRRGIVPEACSAWFLPRVVGINRALDWTLSGRKFGADEALDAGLLKRTVARAELMAAAFAEAREIVDNAAPLSVALTRQMMWRMLGADHPMAAHRLESQAVIALGQGTDSKEGVESFFEKRPPRFTQRPSADMPTFYPWWDEPDFDA